MTGSQDADAKARAWVARLRSGDATSADAEAFEAWRNQSQQNEQAVQRAVHLWHISGRAVSQRHRRPRLTRRLVMGGGLLAATGAAYQAAVFLGQAPQLQSLLADQYSDTGAPTPLNLSGSGGTLDGASAVRISGPDHVQLLTGAVYVQPDADRGDPLKLAAGPLLADTATGAAELRFGDRGPEIACAAGEIHLTAPEDIMLGPGDTVSVIAGNTVRQSTQSAEDIASWRTGVLKFTRRRLGDAVADLNRHRRGRVVLGTSETADRMVSGVFHLDRPDEIVSHMALSLSLDRRDLPGGIVILS